MCTGVNKTGLTLAPYVIFCFLSCNELHSGAFLCLNVLKKE